MDAQNPSVFTGFKQMPWYQPRGLWIDPPHLYVSNGVWQVELPSTMANAAQGQDRYMQFSSKVTQSPI
jgi:bifunctional dethiobiotin synthetase / adenosylmethionine---8-amino-7-oxononanoate aminotransferase